MVDIKKQKDAILSSSPKNDTINDEEYTRQLNDMLSTSKEVLANRLAGLQKENASLVKTNEKLTTQNEKLEVKLQKANEFFEEEKGKNVKLNEILSQVNQSIQKLENQGSTAKAQLDDMKKKKEEYERKIEESNKVIATQTNQIGELGSILRKVNIECYFIFEEGNIEEQAKIFITSESLSSRYLKYFTTKKPVLHFDFNINKDLFDEGIEKVELKIFNSSSTEVYSVSKALNGSKLQITITNKTFPSGNYTVELKSGAENLLIGGKYKFKVG